MRADKRLPGCVAKHRLVVKVGLAVRHVDALASTVGPDVGAVNLARKLVPRSGLGVFLFLLGAWQSTDCTYTRSDRGQSDVQGSAPDVVAPQVVESSHGLLVQSGDALVGRIPLLVGSDALRERVSSAFALSLGGERRTTSFSEDEGKRLLTWAWVAWQSCARTSASLTGECATS